MPKASGNIKPESEISCHAYHSDKCNKWFIPARYVTQHSFVIVKYFAISHSDSCNNTIYKIDLTIPHFAVWKGVAPFVSVMHSYFSVGRSLAGWPFSALTGWIGWGSAFFAVSGCSLVAIIAGSCLSVFFHHQHMKQKKEK